MARRQRRAHTLVLALALALPTLTVGRSEAQAAEGARLTLDRLYSLPHLTGTAPRGLAWSEDGSRLTFLWNDEGHNFLDVWVVAVDDAEPAPRRITQMPQLSSEPTADPLATALEQERRERDFGVSSILWEPGGERLVFTFRGDLWAVSPGEDPVPLTATAEAESAAAFSPDGSTLAFLRAGDLWLLPADTDTDTDDAPRAVRLTAIGGADRIVGEFAWSPDGSRLLIVELDRSGIPERGIPDYLSEETQLHTVRRAYPGEEPERQRVGLVAASGGEIDWLTLSDPAPDMILGCGWSPDGNWLAVDTSDLYAKDRRLFAVDLAAGGAAHVAAADRDPLNETFYFWRIAWSTDSQWIYFLSDRDQDYHVYAVAPADRGEPKRLTRGAWAVAEIHPIAGGLIAVGNRGRSEQRHLFRISDDGGKAERVSKRPGTHSPSISPDGRHAAVLFSSDKTPPELLLTSLAGPDRERPIVKPALDEFEDYRWVRPRYVSFPSHVDGTTLHGRLTLPPDFDPKRSYPAILGSVYTDSVRNQWGGRTAHPTWGLDQFLAQEGYVLLNVDVRGSWGRGRDHRRGIRLDYGGMDIEDLDSGVRFLAGEGYVDIERIGIWGSSYGGLMTAMSLFRKPHLYAAGVAGAPATNVRHALTGQMAVMMRPEDQPAEYDDSSPFLHARGLEDPLMIIHGMRDRIVLFKDSVTLLQRLILLGKDVELVALPNAGHGWDNEGLAQTRFAFEKLVGHFERHLKPAAEAAGDAD